MTSNSIPVKSIRLLCIDSLDTSSEPTIITCKPKSDREITPLYKQCNYVLKTHQPRYGKDNSTAKDILQSKFYEFFDDENQKKLENALGTSKVIEVSFPHDKTKPDYGYASKLFPWEDVINLVARRGPGNAITVVRHLDYGESHGTFSKSSLKFLGVESVPGTLEKVYDLKREIEFCARQMGIALTEKQPDAPENNQSTGLLLRSPSVDALKTALQHFDPHIVHIAGVDLDYIEKHGDDLGLPASLIAQSKHDGILLAGNDGNVYNPLLANDLAALLSSHTPPPRFVALATGRSARRMAPRIVASGISMVMGVHGELDDAFSLSFFPLFYQRWKESSWKTLHALDEAMRQTRGQTIGNENTIVLWSDVSLITQEKSEQALFNFTSDFHIDYSQLSATDISVNCRPFHTLNYCALHNKNSLFEVFTLNVPYGKTGAANVKVTLNLGNHNVEWRKQVKFTRQRNVIDFNGDEAIHLPLNSQEIRQVQEPVHSVLYIEIECDGHVIESSTHTVTLSPIDQWMDTFNSDAKEGGRHWLPSFVFPRDPEVVKIVNQAESYLIALTDDRMASFDGYQSADAYEDAVELQVRAIWYALTQNFHIAYSNPPPTYSPLAQRMRSPTQIFQEGRGTCIDLSLLLCACLEYIGIFSGVILIPGHAFPVWWNTEWDYDEFILRDAQLASDDNAQETKFPPWMFEKNKFNIINKAKNDGLLSMIESTRMCFGDSFYDAVDTGRKNLTIAHNFDALIDIHTARTYSPAVTPLPIIS